MITREEAIDAADELVELIKPLLAGQSPIVVGSALAQLVAILLAGHHPMIRDAAMTVLIGLVHDLISVEVEILIEDGEIGPEWREGSKQ